MNKCGNCKHWISEKEQLTYPLSVRADGYGLCERISSGFDEDEKLLQEDSAYCMDEDRYGGWIVSKPEFGCALWEAKSEQS